MTVLEICCYSSECALTAAESGADRIELCSAPKEGGLTPSFGVLQRVRQHVTIPVHPIVRPRGGDFCYSDEEFASMLADIELIRDLGFPGLVTGVLTTEGNVDLLRMEKVMDRSRGLAVTYHRAFDMCRSPFIALKELHDLGINRILTSGQQATAEQGISLITELNAQPDAPIIMAGSGVRLNNLDTFVSLGITEVHSSAGYEEASPMKFCRSGISMSHDAQRDEFHRYRVNGSLVAKMKARLTGTVLPVT